MFRYLICGILLVFALSTRQSVDAQEAAPPETLDFVGHADYWNPEISPSGKYLAGIRRDGMVDYLIIADLDTDPFKIDGVGMGDYFVNWMEWVTDDRLLVSVSGFLDYRTMKELTREQIFSHEYEYIPYTRLVSMDRKGKNIVAMFGDSRRMRGNFSLGRVTSFLRDDPRHILMPARMNGDLDLFKVNILDGSFERVATGTDNTILWFVDDAGVPVFRINSNNRGTVLRVYARDELKNGKVKWKKIRSFRFDKTSDEENTGIIFRPLSPGPTESTYYVLGRAENDDTTSVYLYDFETDTFVKTIKKVEGFDINGALFDDVTGNYLGAFYTTHDKFEIDMVDGAVQAHLAGLNTYFENEVNVIPLQSARNEQRWLIYTNGPRDPGSYHIYDRDEQLVSIVANKRTSLSQTRLAASEVIHYKARDGLELTGYLTRPVEAKPGDALPLVVMPHGGPELRDIFGFDDWAQLYAANGYQVFQPNFRGSGGFGKSFAERGHRQWGRTMQTDIEDGYLHLINHGLAEQNRACIVGFSYGGYAALAAATLTPDLYECVVAMAPVSDPIEFLKWFRREEGRDSEGYRIWVERIGDPRKDKDFILETSPYHQLARVTAPILLTHGKEDTIVPVKQSRRMNKALAQAGKDVTYLELKKSGHSFRPNDEQHQELKAILEFVKKHLPLEH